MALEALREPLETGTITISRAARRSEFPARFQLIAAMNPCPCGYLGSTLKACRCTPDQVSRYQGVGSHSCCEYAIVTDTRAPQLTRNSYHWRSRSLLALRRCPSAPARGAWRTAYTRTSNGCGGASRRSKR